MATINEYKLSTMNERDEVFFQALGGCIAGARKSKGLTQRQLSEMLGIAQQTLAHYEVARLKLPASFLPELSRIFDCTVDELLGMEEKKEGGLQYK